MTLRCYLDHHTATRPYLASLDQLLIFYKERWGSMSAPHQMGQDVQGACKGFLEMVHDLIGADVEDHFYFCSSGAEAIHHVLMSHYFESVRETGKTHILTTNLEEAALLISLKRMEKLGCVEKMVPVNKQGQITRELLEEHLNPRTSLFSLSWANGLTGVIHPIADLAEVCRARGVNMHVDASYVIGKLFFRFDDLPIDYLTFDGHVIHSPQGTGGLFVKSQVRFQPFVGQHSINAPGIGALALALKENERHFDHVNLEIARLRDKFERGICSALPETVVFFNQVDRLPNCCALGFPRVMSDALLYLLHRKGVYATVGGGRCQKLSHVLIAAGISQELAQCALSFSLSYETTEEQIDYVIQTVVACVQQLQTYSIHLLKDSS